MSSPPVNSYQKRATTAYNTMGNQHKNERELMAEAMRTVINNLTLARDAYLTKSFETMLEYNNKSIKIVDVLREELASSDALKDPEAKAPALYLMNTYKELIVRIADVLTTPAPQEEFNALIELLKPIYRAWLPVAEPKKADSNATS